MGNSLYYAARDGDIETVKDLLAEGADPDDGNHNQLRTPLMEASGSGHHDLAELLLTHKANPNHQSNDCSTSLIGASRYGQRDCAELLLRHKADVNLQNNIGCTPLMAASMMGYRDCADLLLGHKGDVNRQNNNGDTSLTLTNKKGFSDCAELLLTNKADVNHQDKWGATAIGSVSRLGYHACAELLLIHKAYPSHKDQDGKTPLDWAKKEKHKSIVALLNHVLAVRQWCRIFVAPDRFLEKSPDEQKMLINFFIEYPGLQRLIGGALMRFYDPRTADRLKKPNDCVVM